MVPLPVNVKWVANALAESLSSEDGSRALGVIRHLSRSLAPARPVAAAAPAAGPRRVGIWEEQQRQGHAAFVRKPGHEPWHVWADEARIDPKPAGRRRVVLLGESVARGFFYDPVFNPARALRALLSVAQPSAPIDVVDLARTDQSMSALVRLAGESLALEPDALVVFAGNNWHPAIGFDHGDLADIAALVRTGEPWHRVKDYLESRLQAQVEACLREIAAIAASRGIPAVFVLPEGNLADWQDECAAPPLLPAREAERWADLQSQAESAATHGDDAHALACARALMALDDLTTPVGPTIVGRWEMRQGRAGDARRHFELARDAAICWPRPDAPRCYSTIQAVVRRDAVALGLILIDLPARLQEYMPGQVPGRRIFLDYCHLSVEGVRWAMSLVAEALVAAFGGSARWDDLCRTDLCVPPEAEACAHLLAAVHNATWNQRPDVIHHHCQQAIDRWPPIERSMRLFIDFYLRRAPSWACGSFERLAGLQNAAMLTHWFNPRSLLADKPLHLALVRELARAVAGQDAGFERETADLLAAEHGVDGRGVDLLGRSYHLEPLPAWLDRGTYGFVRMFERESRFQLVCRDPRPLSFVIVHRTPGALPGDTVDVTMNGASIGVFAVSDRWRRDRVDVPDDRIVPGVHHVTIRWPAARWSERARRDEIAQRLEQGDVPDVRGVYGELYQFRAVGATIESTNDATRLVAARSGA